MSRITPALALVAMMLCAYYPATHADFLWDDHAHVVDDPHITSSVDGLQKIWFSPGKGIWNYWPITRSSFWLENQLWGISAAAAHRVNLLLHVAGVLVLYFGLRRFNVPCAWFIAGLFALHPILVESVTWITGRKNALSGLFYLGCIWSYLSFDENRNPRAYAAALLLFLCCLLSKSSTVVLPVILIFSRIAFGKTWQRQDVLLLLPFFALSLAAGIGSIWFEEYIIGSSGPAHDHSFAERTVVAGRIPFFYLRHILYPWPLIFVYPKWQIDPTAIVAWLPLAGLIVIAVALLKKYATWGRPLFLGLGAFLATLFPVLGFFDIAGMQYSFVANHWAYLSTLPLFVLAGVLLAHCRPLLARRIICGTILLACGVLTWHRNSAVFQNPESLWNHTIEKNPGSWMARNNLGFHLTEQGRIDEAISHLKTAVSLKPDFDDAHYNLAIALTQTGDLKTAEFHYQNTLRLSPDYSKARNNLGNVILMQGRTEEAIGHYTEAARQAPADSEARNNLGNALLLQGRTDEALDHFNEAVRLDPGNEKAQYNLGATLLEKGDAPAAIPHLDAALRLDPNYTKARDLLNEALESQQ